jgi:hypothetical protein
MEMCKFFACLIGGFLYVSKPGLDCPETFEFFSRELNFWFEVVSAAEEVEFKF